MPRPGSAAYDLSYWQRHIVAVQRFVRSGQGGTVVYADAEDVSGMYIDAVRLVTGPDGKQVAAAGTFVFPNDVDYVPVRSRLTLPATFGDRAVTVITASVRDGGGQPNPDRQEVTVL